MLCVGKSAPIGQQTNNMATVLARDEKLISALQINILWDMAYLIPYMVLT